MKAFSFTHFAALLTLSASLSSLGYTAPAAHSSLKNGVKITPMKMRYVPLFDQKISFLNLGTVELGREWGIDHEERKVPTDDKAKAILQTAVAKGMSLIDTASSYGSSEERIGQYLPSSRYRYLIITKPGEHNIKASDPECKKSSDSLYCIQPASAYDFSYQAILKDFQISLHKLNRTQIDVALLHLDNQTAKEVMQKGKAWQALVDLKKDHKVKWIGVSVNGESAKYIVTHFPLDVLETEYSLINQSNAATIQLAHQKGMAVIVRGGLGTGLLTNQVASRLQDEKMPYRKQVLALLKLVHGDYDQLTALALAFLYENPSISSVIMGASLPLYIQKNIDALDHFNEPLLLKSAKTWMSQFSPPSEYTENMGEYYTDSLKK